MTTEVHPKAIEKVHNLSISHWEGPMKILISYMVKLLKKAIMGQVKKVLASYQETELYRLIIAAVQQFIQQLNQEIDVRGKDQFGLEMGHMIAYDRDTLNKLGSEFFTDLKKRRKEELVKIYLRHRGSQLPPDPAKANKIIEIFDLGTHDFFLNELKLMAVRFNLKEKLITLLILLIGCASTLSGGFLPIHRQHLFDYPLKTVQRMQKEFISRDREKTWNFRVRW